MKAGQFAKPYPTISASAPAEEAGRLLAGEHVDVLLVHDDAGLPLGALHDIGLLKALLPSYLLEDRALARLLGDGDADELWSRLNDKTVGDLLDPKANPLPSCPDDATLVQVAAEMCASGASLIAVVDGDRIIGGITSSALITELLGNR
ncbi:MAG: CBS domain-containing protein [Mycobacteriales bacterium]